jgi:hypothetical protein
MSQNAQTTTAGPSQGAVAQDDYRHSMVTHSPIVWGLVGLLGLGFAFAITLVQVQTNEAFMVGGVASLLPHISIVGQIWDLVHGQMEPDMIEAASFGWCVWIVTFMSALGTEKALHTVHIEFNNGIKFSSSLSNNAQWRARFSFFLFVALTVLNTWTDIVFAPTLVWWKGLLFAIAQFTVTFYVGPRAIHLIEAAIIDFRRPRKK